MTTEGFKSNMSEIESQPGVTVEMLAPDGLGFGEGSISTKEQLRSGELHPDALAQAIEIVKTDRRVFVPVDAEADDDGCGDGRPVGEVFCQIDGVKQVFNKSLRRAKVFGGGLAAAASMWRTVEGVPKNAETVLGDRTFIADKLSEKGIHFGGHTDSHASGEACGCGAIDKYPLITKNAVNFEDNIRTVLAALYGDTLAQNQRAIDEAFNVYKDLAQQEGYFVNASGKETEKLMLEKGAVLKRLEDNHLEDIIVINDVEGMTFDQRQFDEICKDQGLPGTIQVFAVDTWRGRMYADATAAITAERSTQDDKFDYEYTTQVAYADFLIRTLAVSGTLTAGDLPVLGRREEVKSNYALAS